MTSFVKVLTSIHVCPHIITSELFRRLSQSILEIYIKDIFWLLKLSVVRERESVMTFIICLNYVHIHIRYFIIINTFLIVFNKFIPIYSNFLIVFDKFIPINKLK